MRVSSVACTQIGKAMERASAHTRQYMRYNDKVRALLRYTILQNFIFHFSILGKTRHITRFYNASTGCRLFTVTEQTHTYNSIQCSLTDYIKTLQINLGWKLIKYCIIIENVYVCNISSNLAQYKYYILQSTSICSTLTYISLTQESNT